MDPATFNPSGNVVPNHPGDLDGLQAMDSLVHHASFGINFNLDAVDENMIPSSKGMFGCNLEASDSVQNLLIRSDFACTASNF